MIVTCESCGTKFKVDTSKITKKRARVRCSKCKQVFTIEIEKDEKALEREGEKVIVLDDSMEENIARISPREFEEDVEEKALEDVRRSRRTYDRTEKKPSLSRTKLGLLLIPAIIIVVALFFYYWGANIGKKVESKDKKVTSSKPLVSILPQSEAYFIENAQAGHMLVVQGEVINNSSFPVSFVLLEGKLISTNGKVVLNQRFYAGNIMSKEELAQLPVDKIQSKMMVREGDNLSNVHIKPGSKVPFMVVFYNMPPIDELSDYAIEFVSAEAEKPSSAGSEGVKNK